MIAVDQTTFGIPGGNCFSACVASLLELGIDDVPYFMAEPAEDWFGRFASWLRPRGFYPLCLTVGDEGYPGYYVLSGQSPRRPDDPDALHSVVARGTEIVHDPHPSRDGLLSRRDAVLLVPADPAWYPENCCEHGDHAAPPGRRFCSEACAECDGGVRPCSPGCAEGFEPLAPTPETEQGSAVPTCGQCAHSTTKRSLVEITHCRHPEIWPQPVVPAWARPPDRCPGFRPREARK